MGDSQGKSILQGNLLCYITRVRSFRNKQRKYDSFFNNRESGPGCPLKKEDDFQQMYP